MEEAKAFAQRASAQVSEACLVANAWASSALASAPNIVAGMIGDDAAEFFRQEYASTTLHNAAFTFAAVALGITVGIGIREIMREIFWSSANGGSCKVGVENDSKVAKKGSSGGVRVGVGAVVLRPDGRLLVGRRKGSHGSGQWAFPGGWLNSGESFEACALRELEEETGIGKDSVLRCKVWDVAPSNNMEFSSASVFVACWVGDEGADIVKVMEPHKCHEWRWIADNVPSPLFWPLEYVVTEKREELMKLILSSKRLQ